MSKMQRTKGATEERRVASVYKTAGYENAKRNLAQYQSVDGRDLDNTQPFCVQIKVGKKPNIRKALIEAESAIDSNYVYPVAHVRIDREEPIVAMRETVFFYLLMFLK